MRNEKRESIVAGTKSYKPADSRHKLQHIAQKRLDHIVRQVHTEGYHVERISSFDRKDVELIDIMGAIHDWAGEVALKATFNERYDVCVFERF